MTAALLPVVASVCSGVMHDRRLIGRIPFMTAGARTALGIGVGLWISDGAHSDRCVAGWPLMYATIGQRRATEFDAFSRSYSMSSRAVHYLWFGLVVADYGAFVTTFISLVASLVFTVGGGVLPDWGAANAAMLLGSPERSQDRLRRRRFRSPRRAPCTLVAGAWLQVVGLLVAGFAGSFFWTSTTGFSAVATRGTTRPTSVRFSRLLREDKDELRPFVGVAALRATGDRAAARRRFFR